MKNAALFAILVSVSLLAGCTSQPAPTATPTPIATPTPAQTLIACTADAMECPDGSFVGRVPPSCAFAPCQEPTATPAPTPEPTATQVPTPEPTIAPATTQELKAAIEDEFGDIFSEAGGAHMGPSMTEIAYDFYNQPTYYQAIVDYKENFNASVENSKVLYEVRIQKNPAPSAIKYTQANALGGREYYTGIYASDPVVAWYGGSTVHFLTVNSTIGFKCSAGRYLVSAYFNENVARLLGTAYENVPHLIAPRLLERCAA